jgi:adenine-specific DNA-methyltransferase
MIAAGTAVSVKKGKPTMPELSLNLLRNVSGVGAATVRAFAEAGYRSLNDLEGVTLEQLTQVPGVGEATAQAILDFLSSAASSEPVQAYRHDATRKNIPPAGLAGQGRVAEAPSERYFYDPHLPPVLRFDETGQADSLPPLLAKARQSKLSADEVQLLAEALRRQQPWLEWAGKREKRWFDVDPVALHIHERVAAEAIIATARRRPLQPSLFADPELEYREAIKFYEHEMDWTNRLILGDSLTVMHSLVRREDLAGKVQMIYMDPPYGIKYASNFQPFVNSKEVGSKSSDLTREPEQIRAYRDTWTLGVH